MPGHAFYPDGCGKRTVRLDISNATSERIEEGIRLGVALQVQISDVVRSKRVPNISRPDAAGGYAIAASHPLHAMFGRKSLRSLPLLVQ